MFVCLRLLTHPKYFPYFKTLLSSQNGMVVCVDTSAHHNTSLTSFPLASLTCLVAHRQREERKEGRSAGGKPCLAFWQCSHSAPPASPGPSSASSSGCCGIPLSSLSSPHSHTWGQFASPPPPPHTPLPVTAPALQLYRDPICPHPPSLLSAFAVLVE